MGKIVHARLDSASETALEQLERIMNCSQSEIIRESLIRMLQSMPVRKTRKFNGLGKFRSEIEDLASNKKWLNGFGK